MSIDPLVIIACRLDHYRWECSHLGSAVAQRVRNGELPPDDAYAWARILGGMARKVLPPEYPCV